MIGIIAAMNVEMESLRSYIQNPVTETISGITFVSGTLEGSEFDLIRFAQKGLCLYKCGNERYLLQVQAPEYKQAIFGTAGGR